MERHWSAEPGGRARPVIANRAYRDALYPSATRLLVPAKVLCLLSGCAGFIVMPEDAPATPRVVRANWRPDLLTTQEKDRVRTVVIAPLDHATSRTPETPDKRGQRVARRPGAGAAADAGTDELAKVCEERDLAQRAYKRLQAEYAEERTTLLKTRGRLRAAEERTAALRDEKDALTRELSTLRSQLSTAEGALADARRECERLPELERQLAEQKAKAKAAKAAREKIMLDYIALSRARHAGGD